MKFKFSLQAVLDARHSRVEALEIELGQLNKIKQQILSKLRFFSQKLHWLINEVENEHHKTEMDMAVVMRLNSNIEYVEIKIEETKQELVDIEKKIELKRLELVHAKQDEEVMEILKEKEYQRLLEKIAQADKSLLDDIYIAQAYRTSKEEL